MLKVRFRKTSAQFKHPFKTSYETKTEQPSLQVAIEYEGFRGIGEAPVISYYDISLEKMIADLQEKAKLVEDYSFTEPARFWHYCHHLFPDNPFLVCALDLAYWDLYTQFKKQSIAEVLEIEPVKRVDTFYTIAQDTTEKMLAKMKEKPWPRYKIKVTDEESIKQLKELVKNTASSFAVDANAAWSLNQAQQFVPMLAELNVLFIEQPLAKENLAEMKLLKDQVDVPFYADESFQGEADLEKCYQAFDGINIKLTKCSGLTPAVKIIEKAKELGLQTMLGCMNETEIGLYPAAQLGGLVTYNDLDGGLLLNTPLRKIRYEAGQIIFN